MVKHVVLGVALVVAAAVAAVAQSRPSPAERDELAQARHNIFVMEGVLERAVEFGADRLRRQVHRLMPDMLLISGAAEARGFRLDGYGVFFDVEVPVMRRSMAWSLRTMLEENGGAATTALQQLKAAIERMAPDAGEKARLLQAIRRLELQVGPPSTQVAGGPAMPASQRGTVTSLEAPAAEQAPPPPSAEDRKLLEDPSGAYEREVISALIDAMLDHSGPAGVGPDEWLTVAARDNEHRDRLVPGDPYELLTIVLRVKGSDLADFRAERITREEARKRVEVREF